MKARQLEERTHSAETINRGRWPDIYPSPPRGNDQHEQGRETEREGHEPAPPSWRSNSLRESRTSLSPPEPWPCPIRPWTGIGDRVSRASWGSIWGAPRSIALLVLPDRQLSGPQTWQFPRLLRRDPPFALSSSPFQSREQPMAACPNPRRRRTDGLSSSVLKSLPAGGRQGLPFLILPCANRASLRVLLPSSLPRRRLIGSCGLGRRPMYYGVFQYVAGMCRFEDVELARLAGKTDSLDSSSRPCISPLPSKRRDMASVA